ncbi:anaerobic selenocysteine-containing dehydrogenase [Ilumatobacter fluminis]|uniref:Anaerobic selenocysteine-containing dehydrogenase n=1 Tax=Ilumatobacter fluminis TaxID=467091 RepID=A0A4R7I4J0_9ACTN|nr:molybdopterin-dependent oxidoreductase [Ilumatobacter fluminis]TDT18220.1 anaerobic selenocysteine-containing dehydrogenase [Ilumatobacter fluminis]
MTVTGPAPGDTTTDRRIGYSVCTICDIGCQLRSVAEDGKIVQILPHDSPAVARNICYKGTAAPHIHNHAERIRVPLKRVGERGDDRWEEISYEQAMDEIAGKLRTVVDTYGPEALAVSTSGWNTQTTHGFDRRFMNLLGSPNWISGVALCAGNTAAVNRLTYGWMPFPDISNSSCVVLLGHNPRKHSWTPIYNMIEGARKRGAATIVVDPRISDQAEKATIHLQIEAGTDSALLLGWLKVIIDEHLYDASFVDDWCVGFDELKARADEYPLDRVAGICGVPADRIAEAARIYARADGACIPWTPITDQQLDSTSGIRLQSILRAITGNLDVVGGETLNALNPGWLTEADLQLHDELGAAQRAKQLGYDTHPVFTYRTAEMLRPHLKRVWGREWVDQVMGCHMANPTEVFRAMADGDPYPVKAFITLGNNTLLSYPNQHQIHRALLNQDLIVAHEIFMTPTAMLADYVLPGDVFTERNHIADAWAWGNRLTVSERIVDPPGEASSTFRFWTDLGRRFGFEQQFPWDTLEQVLDHRLEPSGRTWTEFRDSVVMEMPPPAYRKYRKTGFATPSGKVELSSSILEALGFDPLPYYRAKPKPTEEYPYLVFSGVREDPFFQTGQRNIGVLRRRVPAPSFFVHPDDAARDGLVEGEWARLETPHGQVRATVSVQSGMRPGHLRVPHGWWYPETRGDVELAGAFVSSDAVLTIDSDELVDYEQGVPHFKGYPGRLVPCLPPDGMGRTTLEG